MEKPKPLEKGLRHRVAPSGYALIPATHRHGGSRHRRLSGRRNGPSIALADANTAGHGRVYRAMIGDRRWIPESVREGLTWLQRPRIERTVVGGHGMRMIAVISPRYRVSRLDSCPGRLEVEIFDRHPPRMW